MNDQTGLTILHQPSRFWLSLQNTNKKQRFRKPERERCHMEKCALVLVLTLCAWLSNGGSATAVTFSSKLIHRFSEEGMALWNTRNGNAGNDVVSWPKKNSLEYLDLLARNDLKWQKMKLSSQQHFLFPSQGSETIFFGNELNWLHYTWIDIGTPNVSFLVALDAGSDMLWVPCDCIQCAPLSASNYSSLDKDLSEYTPSLSSSSKNLSCHHPLCELSSYCRGPNDPCPYIVGYESDNTTTSGYLVEDDLHLKSLSGHAAGSLVQASIIIGCGRIQTGGYLDGAAPDGLMGLGPGNMSVPSLLAKAGLIQNSFSICLNDNGSGSIYFGDKGLASQQSTPFLPIGGKYEKYFVRVEHLCVGGSCVEKSGFLVMVDSGTSFTYLPPEIYDKAVVEFDKQVNARRISSQADLWKYCYDVRANEPFKVPSMRLKFARNQSLEIHNHIYSYTEEGFTVFCLTVLRGKDDTGVIGQNFMIGHRFVFNRENMKLGWSPSSCQDLNDKSNVHLSPPPTPDESTVQFPRNEQQNTNNTQAAAPEVAGRASIKPSAASSLHIPTLLCWMSPLLLL